MDAVHEAFLKIMSTVVVIRKFRSEKYNIHRYRKYIIDVLKCRVAKVLVLYEGILGYSVDTEKACVPT